MPKRTHHALSLCLLAVAFGCRSFGPARPQTLASLSPMPLARLVPGRFEVELTSPSLSGTFDAVCAVDRACCRLQLFPDIGGKVLDLELRADTVVATMPGSRYEAVAPLAEAPPHVALVFAAVLAELLAPVVPERVLGERSGDGGPELRLAPALGSGRVTVRLGPNGHVDRYGIELGWLEFTLDAAGVLSGRGFSGALRPLPASPGSPALNP